MKSIEQFLSESIHSYNHVTLRSLITEADATKKRDLIFQFLKKKIADFLIEPDKLNSSKRKVNGQDVVTYWGIDRSKEQLMLVGFNFDKNGSIYSIDFYEPGDFKAMFPGYVSKSALSIFSNGNSAVLLLPVTIEVCKTRKFDLPDDKAKQLTVDEINGGESNKEAAEESEQLDETPRRSQELRDLMTKSWRDKQDALAKYKASGTVEDKIAWKKAVADWKKIYWAAEQGARTVEDLNFELKKNVSGETPVSTELKQAEQEVDEKIDSAIESDISSSEKSSGETEVATHSDSGDSEKKDEEPSSEKQSSSKKKDFLKFDFKIPEGMDEFEYDPLNIFASMEAVVTTVADGGTNLALICGAPGLGKSFRIEKLMKELGFKLGENFAIVKGRLGTKALYTTLYKYRNKGQIVFLDDADSALADQNSRNVLKAACDTTIVGGDDEDGEPKGRKVSYNVGQRIRDTEGNEIPHDFYYNGGLIIATNWRAGKVESAIRDRALTMELDFDNNQVLKIIYDILDKINIDGVDVPLEIREQAFGVLKAIFEDKNAPKMRLSCRAFIMAAKFTYGMRRIPDSENKQKQLIMTIRNNLINLAAQGGKTF